MDIQINTADRATELCHIMHFFGSDKGHPLNEGNHNYTRVYYDLFLPVRNNKIRVFELGLGTNNTNIPSNMGANGKPGASLRGWRQFFPNATIFGADIDRSILFEEERIKTYYCDQGSPEAIHEMWSTPELHDDFDIIIEDGYHVFHHNVVFFENSHFKLKVGGVFVIEDVAKYTLEMWDDKIRHWQEKFPNMTFRKFWVDHEKNPNDNCLIIAQRKF